MRQRSRFRWSRATRGRGRVETQRDAQVRELGRVAQEEDGRVVADPVPVALLSLELDREATRVTGAVVRAALTADGREANGDRALLASRREHVGQAEVIERLGALEEAVSSSTFSVDNTLGDPFTIEVREQVDQVEVLKEERSVLASADDLVRVRLRATVGGRVQHLSALGVAVLSVAACVRCQCDRPTHSRVRSPVLTPEAKALGPLVPSGAIVICERVRQRGFSQRSSEPCADAIVGDGEAARLIGEPAVTARQRPMRTSDPASLARAVRLRARPMRWRALTRC